MTPTFETSSLVGTDTTVLVVAKAPVPGLAKTRLMKAMTADEAAEIAAAALLDTLAAVASIDGVHRIVAMTGDLSEAASSEEIATALGDFTVIPQRGEGFAGRLVHAHHDAFCGGPIVQIGMDTPQLDPSVLISAAETVLSRPGHCVLGDAVDGGWWMLAVPEPTCVSSLSDVRMSQADTGTRTAEALVKSGLAILHTDVLLDADEASDLEAVAARCRPGSRFAAAVQRLRSP